LGSYEAALAPCDTLITRNPVHIEALNTRGVVLTRLRRFAEALASYDAALAAAPDRIDIQINRGSALLELERYDEAIASFDQALAVDPENAVALINRGNGCVRAKRFADALASFDKALAINPDRAVALTDRGAVLAELDRFDEALVAHERALAIDPRLLPAHINRGNVLLKQNRLDAALLSYADALALEPENPEVNFNAAVTKLCLGNFREGWKQYEYRWKKKPLSLDLPDYPQPIWRGDKDLHGKTIFLRAEQGLGDTINFARYAPLVAKLGAKVILGVQRPLRALATTVPGVSLVRTDNEIVPDFDLYCPLLSLPLAFATELETIPANIPYLWPLEERLAKWRERVPANGRLRIGICWAGSSMHANDRHRSIPLARFARLLAVPDLDFVSVQKDVSAADAAILRAHGVAQLGQEFTDFADTAAVVAMLDLLIAVDTSVVHLAGAMGKAVALLVPFSPDWRWLLDRTDSPWYPSLRIFRQSATGDWDRPLDRLHRELADVSRRPGRQPAKASC
jgi:tetratricopeptide (TPR) repeat protein